MTSLREHIGRKYKERRLSRLSIAHRAAHEDVVRVDSSLGFDTASVALPADIDLDDRAARMNAFWEKLVDFQHRDVIVVALAVGEKL